MQINSLSSEAILETLSIAAPGRHVHEICRNWNLQFQGVRSELNPPTIKASAVEEERLELHGWVYHFENGQVDFLNQKPATA